MTFYEWVREEARLINADGCSGGTNIDGICCLIHDVAFFHGCDPVDAYRWFVAGHPEPWRKAQVTTYERANRDFRACCFRESKLGYLNPMAWWRYWGVRTKKGRAAWDSHRAREAQV